MTNRTAAPQATTTPDRIRQYVLRGMSPSSIARSTGLPMTEIRQALAGARA